MSLLSNAQVSLQSTLSFDETSAIPGESPCHYVGDPSDDLLSISSLDLEPNPPVEDIRTSRNQSLTYDLPHTSQLSVRLKDNLTSDIGPKPVLTFAAALNEAFGPSYESELCFSKLQIMQKGTSVCPPTKGHLEMTYDIIIAYPYMKKGDYTVHAQMDATDGARMTAFEGTVRINGETDDGDGGWV